MPKMQSRQNVIIDNGNQCCDGAINAIQRADAATTAAVNAYVNDTAYYKHVYKYATIC